PRTAAPDPGRCPVNSTEDWRPTGGPSASEAPSAPTPDDPRVVRALQEYLTAMEAGRKPDRREFQARYPELAETLAECLDGLEFVRSAAPHLHAPAATPRPAGTLPDMPSDRLLGDFRILHEVGRGGMGIVYEAEQLSL